MYVWFLNEAILFLFDYLPSMLPTRNWWGESLPGFQSWTSLVLNILDELWIFLLGALLHMKGSEEKDHSPVLGKSFYTILRRFLLILNNNNK